MAANQDKSGPARSTGSEVGKPSVADAAGTLSRRQVIPRAAGAAAFLCVPRHVLGGRGHTAPSDRLNVAGVGIGGGIARTNLRGISVAGGGNNVVALCDVDTAYSEPTFREFPEARRYTDFREMLEKEQNIDGVFIATPDHNHAVVAMAAMKRGKHVLCVKPLARTIQENRELARVARETGVVTHVTASPRSADTALTVCETIWDGAIGPIREIHAWTDRPLWPQGVARPKDNPPVPKTMDWDLWLGPASERPYHPSYHPWIWRGWWDFGTGSLGDMGLHYFNTIFAALKLGYPTAIQAVASAPYRRPEFDYPGGQLKLIKARLPETAPAAAIVTWDFPAREGLPPVRLRWYDGGMKPPIPDELNLPAKWRNSGTLYIGDKGKLLGGNPWQLLPEAKFKGYEAPRKAGRLPFDNKELIQEEWVAAIKGRHKTSCDFGVAALLTEVALMGNIATRLDKTLRWDADAGQFVNDDEANRFIQEPYRSGWSL